MAHNQAQVKIEGHPFTLRWWVSGRSLWIEAWHRKAGIGVQLELSAQALVYTTPISAVTQDLKDRQVLAWLDLRAAQARA